MGKVPRITPGEARRAVIGGKALLVCAYEEESSCRKLMLDGAITLAEFRERLPALPMEQEIIFYCA